MTSLRVKLTVLVAVPLVVLVVVAVAGVRGTSESRHSAERVAEEVQLALTADDATLVLIQERRLAASSPDHDGLSAQRAQTDEALDILDDSLERQAGRDDVDGQDLQSAHGAVEMLPSTRADVESMDSTEDILAAYDQIIEPVLALDSGFDQIVEGDVARQLQTQQALVRITNEVALEESLLQSAFNEQELSAPVHTQLTATAANEETWTDQFLQTADDRQLEDYDQLGSTQSATEAGRFRDRILGDGPSEAIEDDGVVWATATDRKIDQLMALTTEGATELESTLASERGGRLQAYGLLAAALALAALVLFALRWLIIQRIDRLAADSEAAADDIDAAVNARDPSEISQMEAPGEDELDDVAHAFAAAQDAVVSLLDEQTKARDKANEVFLNFGRRAQNLVTRQIGQIDDLEARTDDPDVLADLFLLDHLATRLRRTAESLVLLAGSESPRPWTRPVSVVNVIRAAAAEASDYSRVDLAQVGPGAITGAVANDVSHLLAELIDNALTYSPPESRVSISGDRQADGRYIVSISDAGLGMSGDQLAEANARLQDPEATIGTPAVPYDPASDRGSSEVPLSKYFGLHVAGRIAARHNIDVKLAPSPFNGITAAVGLARAVMVLPTGGNAPALTREADRHPDPAGPEPTSAPHRQQAAPAAAPVPPTTPPPGTAQIQRRTVHPRSAIAMPAAGSTDE